MIQANKIRKIFLSHRIDQSQDELIYLDIIEDKFMTISKKGRFIIFDDKWDSIKDQILINTDQLKYLDQNKNQYEILIVFHNKTGIIIARIQLSNLQVEVSQLSTQLDNIWILNSVSTQPTFFEAINLENQEVYHIMIYDEIIHKEKIALFDQYQILSLFKLKEYLVGQNKDFSIIIMELNSSNNADEQKLYLHEVNMLQKYNYLKRCHQLLQCIFLVYESFVICLAIENQSTKITQVFDLEASYMFINGDKFVQYWSDSERLNFFEFDPNAGTLQLVIELQSDSTLQIQTSQFCNMYAEDFQYIFYDSHQIIILFQIDESPTIKQYIQDQDTLIISIPNIISKQRKTNELINEMDEDSLFQLIKRRKDLHLDDLLNFIKKKGFHKCLLLLSSRIRNYEMFFFTWKTSKQPLLIIDNSSLRQCECFDHQYLKEEFMSSIMNNIQKNLQNMTQFLIYLVNHSEQIFDVEKFLIIIEISSHMKDKRLEIISRIKKQIRSLKRMQTIAINDNHNLKTKLYEALKNGCQVRDSQQCQACSLELQISLQQDELIYYRQCHHVYHKQCLIAKNRITISNSARCPKCESDLLIDLKV